jgi:hypothetical protein
MRITPVGNQARNQGQRRTSTSRLCGLPIAQCKEALASPALAGNRHSAPISSKRMRLFRSGSDLEWLAMSTTGPLHPGQLTRGETLDEACVGPIL